MTWNGCQPMKRYSARTRLFGAVLLVLVLGLLPQASFAHSASCGIATNANTLIDDSANWINLGECWLSLLDGDHSCVVTACVDINNPGGANTQNRYRFATDVNAIPPTDTAYERTAVLTNNAGVKDPDSATVCTVRQIDVSIDLGHAFILWGRKWQAGTSDATVTDSSLGVVCVDADANAKPEEGLNEEANEASSDGSSASRQ